MYLLMYLRTFKISVLKYINLTLLVFFIAPGLVQKAVLKKTKVELDHLADVDMLSIIEKGNRGGVCQTIHRYAKATNKCMKYYD